MVASIDIVQEEKEPIEVEGGVIDYIEGSQYLDSIIVDDGRIDAEIYKRIASTSRAFGALRQAVFIIVIVFKIETAMYFIHVE